MILDATDEDATDEDETDATGEDLSGLVWSGVVWSGLVWSERGSVDKGSHMLSENMWFVWFKTLCSGKNVCGHTEGNVKIGIESVGFAICSD